MLHVLAGHARSVSRHHGAAVQGAASREWFAAWETLEFDYEMIDAGDRVVLLIDQRMRGRSSGVEVPIGRYAQIATFRDGLMIHWKVYMSQAAALAEVEMSRRDDRE